MGRPLFLSLDFGTSSSRAAIFDAAGTLVWQASVPHALPADATRVPADGVRATALRLLAEAGRSPFGGALAAIGVSAQLGLVCLDASGDPLGPVSTWMDRGAVDEARWLGGELGAEPLYRLTGRRPDPELVACKLLRLRREAPERFARISAVLSLKDYIVFLLTGAMVTDPAHASYSMLLDVRRGTWADEVVRAVGIPVDRMPPVRPGTAMAGTLTRTTADATGLASGLPVAVGGPDGTVGAVGAGMLRGGAAVDVLGTTEVLLVATDRPCFHPRGATLVNRHVLAELWVAGGPMTTTGGALQWMAETLLGCAPGETGTRLDELEAGARELPPGADGLLAIPSLVGERAPFWDPAARAAFVGLSLAHRPAHLYRALVEGAAFLLRAHVETLVESGAGVEVVVLAGGGSRSRLACQIRGDVLGRPLALCPTAETTALGAAVLAAVAAGWQTSADAAHAAMGGGAPDTITPDADRSRTYAALYPAFVRLHGGLRALRAPAAMQ